tara:strand:+ start:166 stop:1767 length:1602 start_codon:yes stop_codon:yes gene_type:complete
MPLSDYTYSSRASFAYVLCTTSSAVDAITTSALPVFDSDHDDVVFTNNVSSDITYTANAGTFTFAKAGTYHVVLTLVTSQETADKVQTTLFQLNSAAAIYLAAPFIDFAMDPTETTHQRVITIAAGDVLHIKTKTAGNSMGIVKGTSVVITEITSGVFASSTVTTAGSNNTTDAFNPFDTDLSGGPVFASGGKIESGVVFDGAAGTMTVPSAGRYLIMINHIFAASASTNSSVAVQLHKTPAGGTLALFFAASMRLHSSVDPTEQTMCIVEDLGALDALKISYNIEAGRVHAEKGATFTVIKLQEGQPIVGTGRGVGSYGSAYITVGSNYASTAGATEVNPFDEDNLTGDATFATRASSGIVFNPGAGTFTASKAGLYFIMHTPIIDAASSVVVTTKILVNDVIVSSSDSIAVNHPIGDPASLTNTAFVELQRNDVVTVLTDANTAVNIIHNAGSHICMFRYYGFFEFSDISSVAPVLISDDLTINTFSRENLSAQYERNIDQIPFKFGIRGAGTLRRRGTEPSVVKLGDKKA